ncbi:SMI1/KNR4 family protein [Streptomyces filamentosus]|uniref:SMI1/KNR4 family protein n=1 Tax=Streptomyces filamentosus TaxID=67294 RepID=UPI0033C7030C
MNEDSFDWHGFLRRWQEEWVPDEDEDPDDEAALAPLGRPGGGEAAVAAAEERLGRRLPPSYRAFLAASDGWHVGQSAGIYQLGGAADVDWFRDPFGMTPLYEENLGDDPGEEEVRLAGMWRRALRLETDSDMSHALLDPGDSDADGEWALYVYKGWSGEHPDRHPSFRAYMEAMYRRFHCSRAHRSDFVNATTRARDAEAEEGRLLALDGRYEEALVLLEGAAGFGRPGSAFLLGQVRQLLAPGTSWSPGHLVGDPVYGPELLPLEVAQTVRQNQGPDGDERWVTTAVARGADREGAEAVLGALRDGSHRYAPPGAWGRAVAEARETALRGATDAAWRVLREALPRWEAPGPLLLAPLGLLADPVLGPLVTPERGRELLATPRAGGTGPVPVPAPDLDPPGLVWLTEPVAPWTRRPIDGYRCVWAEGLDPARLSALIGEEGAGPGEPVHAPWIRGYGSRPGAREGLEPWEDRAVVAVGVTDEGWAFAFDRHAHRLPGERLRSPAVDASATGRAVMVWREPGDVSGGGSPAAFHLSVAEDGEERYAFTVRGTEVRRSGAIPEALDPALLLRSGNGDGTGAGEEYGDGPDETEAERRLLRALHAGLGLSLPRFALTLGALRTFATRSWTRAPHAGEGYAVLGFVRHRP